MTMENGTDATCVTVSVIMPAYNASRFIEAAVRSVVEQTFTKWELIVIDDGSRDTTVDIVERLVREDSRITLLCNEENMGVAKTRNRGLDLARGSYVALLDSDDIWHPEKLEKQLDLADKAKADMVYCSYSIVDSQNEKVRADYIVPERATLQKLLKENVVGCSTVLLSKNITDKYRFNTDFYHEDYVLWLQLLQDGYKAVGCTEALVDWRLLENSRSFDKRRSAKNRWRIYRECLHLSIGKSAVYFVNYALAGLRKYQKRK